MTLEERAKAYKEEVHKKYLEAEEQKLCIKAQGFKEDVKAHDIDVINAVENKLDAYKVGRYDGFLAGLKAGRPQWHDLRKDKNDLPSDRHGHVVMNQDWDKVTIRNGRFEYLDGDKTDVLAWCEIPTFDKE